MKKSIVITEIQKELITIPQTAIRLHENKCRLFSELVIAIKIGNLIVFRYIRNLFIPFVTTAKLKPKQLFPCHVRHIIRQTIILIITRNEGKVDIMFQTQEVTILHLSTIAETPNIVSFIPGIKVSIRISDVWENPDIPSFNNIDSKNHGIISRLILLLLKCHEIKQSRILHILITDTQFFLPSLSWNSITNLKSQFPENDSIFCYIISIYDNIRDDHI